MASPRRSGLAADWLEEGGKGTQYAKSDQEPGDGQGAWGLVLLAAVDDVEDGPGGGTRTGGADGCLLEPLTASTCAVELSPRPLVADAAWAACRSKAAPSTCPRRFAHPERTRLNVRTDVRALARICAHRRADGQGRTFVRTTERDCVSSAGRVNHRRRPGRHLATGAARAIQPRAAERDVEIVTEIVPTTMRPPKLIVGPNRCYGDKSPPRSTSSQRNTPTTRPAVAAKIYIDTTDNGPQATPHCQVYNVCVTPS